MHQSGINHLGDEDAYWELFSPEMLNPSWAHGCSSVWRFGAETGLTHCCSLGDIPSGEEESMSVDYHRQVGKPLGSHKESGCPSPAKPLQQVSATSSPAHSQFSLGTGIRCSDGSKRGGIQVRRAGPLHYTSSCTRRCVCSDWLAHLGPIWNLGG